jgi:thiol-disulfide isomerase/thioredoxin
MGQLWKWMWIIGLLIALLLSGFVPAAAQEDEALAKTIEALALRVHSHNLRTQDFTVWMGGDLGDNVGVRPTAAMGEPLPTWELSGFDDSQADFASSDLKRPTLLNVWASWCPPCVQEFPDLTEIALAPDDHPFDVLFINSFDEKEAAAAFLKQQTPGIHVLEDFMAELNGLVGSQALPTSILVDADNTVLAIHVGSMTPAHVALFEMIAEHPGIGSFDPADYPDFEPLADLLPIGAADATPVEIGEAVRGTISDEDFQHAYSFKGLAGDKITITMENSADDLEPYLVLLDPNGERLTETTEYFYDLQAIIEDFTLPADGTYLVVATRFLEADGLSAGKYRLRITSGS